MSEPREPGPPTRRQTNVTTPLHTDHDPILVAALAADDLQGADLSAARTLVASCPDCAELHGDLVGIAAATRTLPAPARIRDFRLGAEDAERLRPRGWRRLVAGFGSPRLAFARPMGVGLATVGLAGLLLTAVAPGQLAILGTAGSATDAAAGAEREIQGDFGSQPEMPPVPEATGDTLAPAIDGAPTGAPAASPVPGDAAAPTTGADGGGALNGNDSAGAQGGAEAGGSHEPAVPWLPIGSIALVGAGVGLLLLRRAGERA
jgi:hypothetical protein